MGSGAMGQLFGARLLLAGEDVTMIDTDQGTIDALNKRGITLRLEDCVKHTAARSARASDLTGEFDLFIIFTKGFHTAAAIESVRHLTGPRTHALTLQNGLGNAETLADVFGAGQTLTGITDFPADLHGPGRISSSRQGKVLLGALVASSNERAVAAMLDRAGLQAAVAHDVRVPIWEKVAFNAALNTVSAVTRLTVGQIADDMHARSMVSAILDETLAVADFYEVPASRPRVEAALRNAFAHHRDHKTSMLLDIEAGRRTEIDSIGGAVDRLGRANGIPTPVLSLLCDLVRAISEGSKQRYDTRLDLAAAGAGDDDPEVQQSEPPRREHHPR